MSSYSILYRGENGKLVSLQVEADSRQALFSDLRKRGVTPIRVGEMNGKSLLKQRPRIFRSIVELILYGSLALALLIGVVACVIFLSHSTNQVSLEGKETSRPQTNAGRLPHSCEISHCELDGSSSASELNDPTIFRKTIEEVTNKVKRIRYLQDPDDPSEYGATEQMLGALLSSPLGVAPIPFPYEFDLDGGVSDYIAGLSNKITIVDKDSTQDVAHKMAIVEAKIDILEMMKSGETPQTIIEDAYKMRVAAARIRSDMIATIQDWIIEDNPTEEAVDVAVQKLNQRLSNDGILLINMEEIEDDLQERRDEKALSK